MFIDINFWLTPKYVRKQFSCIKDVDFSNFVLLQPYAELKDSNGRPDLVVAAEAWDNHIIRDNENI
jgi:hypothetical protein